MNFNRRQADNILRSFEQLDLIKAGKSVPVGTKSPSGDYEKTATGWKRISEKPKDHIPEHKEQHPYVYSRLEANQIHGHEVESVEHAKELSSFLLSFENTNANIVDHLAAFKQLPYRGRSKTPKALKEILKNKKQLFQPGGLSDKSFGYFKDYLTENDWKAMVKHPNFADAHAKLTDPSNKRFMEKFMPNSQTATNKIEAGTTKYFVKKLASDLDIENVNKLLAANKFVPKEVLYKMRNKLDLFKFKGRHALREVDKKVFDVEPMTFGSPNNPTRIYLGDYVDMKNVEKRPEGWLTTQVTGRYLGPIDTAQGKAWKFKGQDGKTFVRLEKYFNPKVNFIGMNDKPNDLFK